MARKGRSRRSRSGVAPVLGLDVGGVIVDRAAHDTDTSFFGNRPMDTPSVPGSFEAIAKLVDLFEHRVHIVSKAGPRISELTRQWLHVTGFFEQTGVDESHLHFVLRRPEKAPICERLGVTHFVDDRIDVLTHMTTVRHRYVFLGGLGPNHPTPEIPKWAIPATDWHDLRRRITRHI